MSSVTSSRRLFHLAAWASLALGCSGSCGSCSSMASIPGGYAGPKSDNAVNVRLSAAGVASLNAHWPDLLSGFAPGSTLSLPIACQKQTIATGPFNTDVLIGDQNLNGACEPGEQVQAQATVLGFSVVPTPLDKVTASVTLRINTGSIKLFANPLNLGVCDLKCAIQFDSAAATPHDPPDASVHVNDANAISATIQFTVDPKWDRLLAFKLTSTSGTQICNSLNAPSKPGCLDTSDLSISNEGGNCLSFACDLLNNDVLKNVVLGLLSPTLQSQVTGLLNGQSCRTCTAVADCPTSTDGTSTQATCSGGVCVDPRTSQCVPRLLGLEGRADLGALLSSVGASSAKVDLSIAAGSTFQANSGLTFGTRAGLQPVAVASCVPALPSPGVATVSPPDFDAAATPGSGYHVGLSVSAGFMNQAFWALHQSGALCLSIGSAQTAFLSTGLFKGFAGSLATFTRDDEHDAPMQIALRPNKPPVALIGAGTFDPTTKKPIAPLLTVQWPDLSFDFYAFLEGRQVRLFTLTADLALPLSLIPDGCDSVTPALGNLATAVTNVRVSNNELLSDGDEKLAKILPTITGLAEAALGSALGSFKLPTVGGFKLKLNESKGVGPIASSGAFDHLALFTTLLPINASCALGGPRAKAELRATSLPTAEQLRAPGPLPVPSLTLEVAVEGADPVEFATKLDDGLWSTFAPAPGGVLTVAHPGLLLQGVHTVWVRARVADEPLALGVATPVAVRIDWEAPTVALSADRAHDRLKVSARDAVSSPSALRYAYQVGATAPSTFGPAREIDLSAVEAQGGVTVLVQDEASNVAQASWRPAQVATHPDSPGDGTATDPTLPAHGCSVGGDGVLLGLLALAGLRRRRLRA